MTEASEQEEYQRLRQWSAVIEDSNYYEILGVLELADLAAIKSAFHVFALAFHPDSHVGAPQDVQATLQFIYQRGSEAYRVLSVTETRAEYDMALARGYIRLGPDAQPTDFDSSGQSAEHARSLQDLCHTPAARLSARRAEQFISQGALEQAKRALIEALAHDGHDNPELDERLEALEVAIFAMGS